MSKQTAVMCLINELKKSKDFQRVINEVNLSSTSVRDIVQETLQMEREQIIDAYNSARNDHHQMYFADEYFNKTYGEKFGENYGGQDE